MGFNDRSYLRGGGSGGGGNGGGFGRQITVGMEKPPQAVKMLLMINLGVFVLQMLLGKSSEHPRGVLSAYFGATAEAWWQLWRYVTFQFLHSTGGFLHIMMNMLGLYMLGSPLERKWGTRRFVKFYLGCGVTAGVAYVVIGNAMGTMADVPIVGASGGVYGILLAAAVLFPHFRLIFFLFPLPIRFACLIIFGIMSMTILQGLSGGQITPDFWSQVAHTGGVVAAAYYMWVLPKLRGASENAGRSRSEGAWKRKMRKQALEQAQVDRILVKVGEKGIASLTRREKSVLKEATRKHRQEDAERLT